MMKLVVGIIGKICSGKGVSCKHLEEAYGAETFRFSDILKEVLKRLHIPNTRPNLQTLGAQLRESFGPEVLADALRADIEAGSAEVAVIDGIRYDSEVELLRGFEDNTLIYITAPLETRHKRALARATRGEEDITPEEFKKAEGAETEKFIEEVGKKADHKIENTGTIEELKEKIDKILEDKIGR